MNNPNFRQRGIALPVMLMIMLTMMVTSVFLIKSINSTTLMASNVAYDSALGKAADFGLITGFGWLNTTSAVSLNAASAGNGYIPTFNPTQNTRSALFWTGSKVVFDSNGNRVEYVIHRLCESVGAWNQIVPVINRCVLRRPVPKTATGVEVGDSMRGDSPKFPRPPEVHYVITSRISGPRGGNIVNQMVVLITAT